MISIHKTPSSRMHNNLPDETQLPNGQKFELLSLALLGVPSMAEKFLEVSNTMKQLQFDQADYVCLKFILLLNQGKRQNLKKMYVSFSNIIFFSRGSELEQPYTCSRVEWTSPPNPNGILPQLLPPSSRKPSLDDDILYKTAMTTYTLFIYSNYKAPSLWLRDAIW